MNSRAQGTDSTANTAVDYALSTHVDDWIRDPVLGDPSFDSFVHFPNNPIHRGEKGGYAWPVNGSFFCDPVSGNWYVYVGDYADGYAPVPPARCLLYRSKDKGATWEALGQVMGGDAKMFDGDGTNPGQAPDVAVLYDNGRYYMLYDYGKAGKQWTDGGLAYAWADKPEGPWHRHEEPIQKRSTEPVLAGRYNRPYAGTLIRRKNDWLLLGMMDAPPCAWTFYAKTAKTPDGPYTPSVLMRHVEEDYFMPPIMEGFPAFAHDGYVYFPMTALGANRNFNILYRAPIEQADDPKAWEIYRYGSVWHSDPVENEFCGIWGQTFGGQVLPDGTLVAMFPCRDSKGLGTINLASRPWDKPFRDRGFVFTGNDGRSFTCLRQGYGAFSLDLSLKLTGTISVVWDYTAPEGPYHPSAGTQISPNMLTRHHALNLTQQNWSIAEFGESGPPKTIASGNLPQASESWKLTLQRDATGNTSVMMDGKPLWSGHLAVAPDGAIGLMTLEHSWTEVDQFSITGTPTVAKRYYDEVTALIGAGENAADWDHATSDLFQMGGADWTRKKSDQFHFGEGIVANREGARVKWNVIGTSLKLYSPKGPGFGVAQIIVDGQPQGTIDLHGDTATPSGVVWSSGKLDGIYHAVVLKIQGGVVPVDCLEVAD